MKRHHVGWVGRDIERMRRSFVKEGATVVTEPIADPLQRVVVQFLLEPAAGELWELVAPLPGADDSPLLARLSRGGGLDHVCWELDVADGTLDDVLATEVARGGRIVCEPVMATAFGRQIAFVYRRSGRLIELVEPRPPGAPL
jgi:methylmalonyl-CoA/ethylmalonyl-CoA epimerase